MPLSLLRNDGLGDHCSVITVRKCQFHFLPSPVRRGLAHPHAHSNAPYPIRREREKDAKKACGMSFPSAAQTRERKMVEDSVDKLVKPGVAMHSVGATDLFGCLVWLFGWHASGGSSGEVAIRVWNEGGGAEDGQVSNKCRFF